MVLLAGGFEGGNGGADAAVIDPDERGTSVLEGPAWDASAFEGSGAGGGALASADAPTWDGAESGAGGVRLGLGDGVSRPAVRGVLIVAGRGVGDDEVGGVAAGDGGPMPADVVERVALVAWHEPGGRRIGQGLSMRELVPELATRPSGGWDGMRGDVIEVVHGGEAADSGAAGAGAPEGHVIPGPGMVGMLGAMAAAYAASRRVRGVWG